MKLGANGLETDAWITADGRIVLDHDGVMRRRGRKIAFADLSADQLPSNTCFFEDLFAACGTEFHLSIDVRDEHALEPIITLADTAGFPLERLWLCHHRPDATFRWPQQSRGARIVDSSRLTRIKEGVETRINTLRESHVDVLNMHYTDWNGGLVTLAHRFERLAFCWDCQHPYQLETALLMGVDAIYSDHVDRMVAAYERIVGFLPRV